MVVLVTLPLARAAPPTTESRKLDVFDTGTPGNAIARTNPSLAPAFLTSRAPTWTIDDIAPRPAFRLASNWAAWVASRGDSVYGAAIDRPAAGSAAGEPAAAGDAVATGVAAGVAAGDAVAAAAGDAVGEAVGAELPPQAA